MYGTPARAPAVGLAVALALGAASVGRARAADGDEQQSESRSEAANAAKLRRLSGPPGRYYRVLGSLAFGDGLRFNNPYRLRTQLGDDGESLSVTAPYVDFGIAGMLGRPDGIQNGAAIHLSWAVGGVPQQVFT